MTTGAISVDSQSVTPGYKLPQKYENGAWVDQPKSTPLDRIISRYREYRPQSVSVRPSASGWRAPTGWHHEIAHAAPTPTSPVLYEDLLYGKPSYREWWMDGFGWSTASLITGSYPIGFENRCIIKALLALKDQDVNLSVAFGERAETGRMFENVINIMVRDIRRFKKLRPRDFVKVMRKSHFGRRKMPEKWLELNYGWQPLMNDVYGACKALNDKERDGDAYRATVVGKVSEKSRKDTTLPTRVNTAAGFTCVRNEFYACKVRLDYVMENPLLASLAQLGITNPAETAWELVPWSFVIDWAVPIGDYLSAFDAALGWSFLGGTCSKLSVLDERGVGYYNRADNKVAERYITMFGDPASYQQTRKILDRTVYESSPLPRFPGIKNPLSTGHVANAASLLASSFR